MAETYQIMKGQLVKLKPLNSRKYLIKKYASFFKCAACAGITILGCSAITWLIYYRCVLPLPSDDGSLHFALLERITTGSLFASFGSAIIAVFTLFTNRYLTSFYENLSILTKELVQDELGETSWRRWSFIPRLSKKHIGGEVHYIGIENVRFVFQTGVAQLVFPLPTTEADFSELPLLRNSFCMKRYKQSYLNHLYETQLLEEYPAWDCVAAIYRCALLYRASNYFVWVGVCFVLESILFTFFYPNLYALLFLNSVS